MLLFSGKSSLTDSQLRHRVSFVSVPWNISCTHVGSGFVWTPLFSGSCVPFFSADLGNKGISRVLALYI